VANAKIATNVIRDAFISADPENKAVYQANAKAYQSKLDALAKWIRLEVAKLPKDKRVLVTSHDALGYFAKDYSFEIHPVQGVSTKDQPSSQKVRALIDDIKKEQVKAIFAENIENPKILAEITRETGAKLGGSLYADGLGAEEANTYESMMRHNVTTIVGALQ
jgi:zinc/manganese transport system substrate-binding protein